MVGGRPSLTAEIVAWMRATEARRPAAERIVDDPFAEAFLSPPLALALAAWRVSGRLADAVQRLSPGLVGFVLCRHRWIDDRLAAAAAAGTRQVVLLGAGYDTRALRLASVLGDATVYELDFPATSERKARLLREHRAELPKAAVRRVAIDFTKERVDVRLRACGFATSERAFFVWEGVSMYLSADAVAATLGQVHAVCASGSELVADFWAPPREPDFRAAAVRMAADALSLVGEPIEFGLRVREASSYFAAAGFRVRELATAAELGERYVRDGRPVFRDAFVAAIEKAAAGT